jgi:hypothetical protein
MPFRAFSFWRGSLPYEKHMNREIPDGLSSEARTFALPIRDALVAAGWKFGVLHWDVEQQRKLAFTAKSPSGTSIYISCDEKDLARKLQELLGSEPIDFSKK